MIEYAIFRTNDHEIHIEKNEENEWLLLIYSIDYSAIKEIKEKHIVKNFKTAYLYIEQNFLQKGNEGNVI